MKATNLRQGAPAPAPNNSSGPVFIVDSDGRRLQLRNALTLLEEQRLLVAMGPHSDNARALQRALIAARVVAIDEDGIPLPQTYRSYEAMLRQVGTAGLIAVVGHLSPAPIGEPLAVFEGEPGEYRLLAYDGGVGLWRIEDDREADNPEIATAKK